MERSPEDWQAFAGDILAFCNEALDDAAGLKQDEFIADRLVYKTALLNLALIGEAANHILKSVQEAHPEIPWENIIGMRHRLIHGYWDIDNNIVWDAVQNKVPALVTALQNLLETEDNSNTRQ